MDHIKGMNILQLDGSIWAIFLLHFSFIRLFVFVLFLWASTEKAHYFVSGTFSSPLWLFACGMGFDTIPSCPLLVWCNVHKDDWSSRWLQPLEKWRDRATQAAPQLSLSICFSLGGITVWMWFWQSDLCNLIPHNMETNNALSVSQY